MVLKANDWQTHLEAEELPTMSSLLGLPHDGLVADPEKGPDSAPGIQKTRTSLFRLPAHALQKPAKRRHVLFLLIRTSNFPVLIKYIEITRKALRLLYPTVKGEILCLVVAMSLTSMKTKSSK